MTVQINENYQTRELRDHRAKALSAQGWRVKKRTVSNQRLHPQYVTDFDGHEKFDTGAGNQVYKTLFPKLYVLEAVNEAGEAIVPAFSPKMLPALGDPGPGVYLDQPGQHPTETAVEYLRRVVSNLSYETESYLDVLPSVQAVLEYFQLWHTYDTDLMTGIVAVLQSGEDPAPYNAFVRRYRLPWSLYLRGDWRVGHFLEDGSWLEDETPT